MNPRYKIINQYTIAIDEIGDVHIDPVIASLISTKEQGRIAMGLNAIQLLHDYPDSTLASLSEELDSKPSSMEIILNRMGIHFDGRTNATAGRWIVPEELQRS